MELPERKIFTVTEFTERIRDLLEQKFPSVWIQGEISNLHAAPSGHVYFTLKDDAAQIRCVMFKIQTRFLKFRLENGLHVIAWGRLSVYGLRGEYQLILDTMEPAGLGSLMLAFEQLKTRLTAEGLFDVSRKKPVPPFPKRIGLVTSARGAAVRDMIRIIRRRLPGTHILVSPATVQGDRAPEEIKAAVRRLCEAGDVDVIILGRGGGAIEDLWAFNDEKVIRTIANCPLPIVSAVGHETDVTLADFAADLRASTPSAAAEMLVPDKRELDAAVLHLGTRLHIAMYNALESLFRSVQELMGRFYDPRRQVREHRMRLDELAVRLSRSMHRSLDTHRRDLESTASRLRPTYVSRLVESGKTEFNALVQRLCRAVGDVARNDRTNLESLSARLDSVSPLRVLSRGYSITFKSDTGALVTDAAQVESGDEVSVRLHRGMLFCLTTGKRDQPEDA
ncbi:MAG TPA: exodeoxyribonuclease VII large subunit [Desulfomonilaceae bacterium]|nr:exodeoxyribonuclease VII large subunit [Desulfomonilaceae bacterium]